LIFTTIVGYKGCELLRLLKAKLIHNRLEFLTKSKFEHEFKKTENQPFKTTNRS